MAKAAPWIVAGVAVDLLGAVLIVTSLPAIGPTLMAGVVALVGGALLVAVGVIRKTMSGPRAPAGSEPGDRSSGAWSPEPELRRPLPRRVRLSRSGRRIVLFWALLTVAVPCYILFAASRSKTPDRRHVAEYFHDTQGEIHDKQVRDGSNGPRYHLYYRYHTDRGREYRASIQVEKPIYDSFKVGDTVTVKWFPQNATVHEVVGLETRPEQPPVVLFTVGLTALMILIFETVRRRHRSLTARGIATAGVIESWRRRGAGYVYVLSYAADGQPRKLRGTERELELSQGDPLTVLYDPGKPHRALIYRLSMYQSVGS